MLPIWLTVLLVALTTHRVTRLITRDQFPLIALPRDAFAQRWAVYQDSPDKRVSLSGKPTNLVMRSLAYLWECDWCMSIWVGAGVAIGTYHWIDQRWWQWTLVAAAASSVTGLIAANEPD